MSNVFDQFDEEANVFDQFDEASAAPASKPAASARNPGPPIGLDALGLGATQKQVPSYMLDSGLAARDMTEVLGEGAFDPVARAATANNTPRSWTEAGRDVANLARAGGIGSLANIPEIPVRALNILAEIPGFIARAQGETDPDVLSPTRIDQPNIVKAFAKQARGDATNIRENEVSLPTELQAAAYNDAQGLTETLRLFASNPGVLANVAAETAGMLPAQVALGGSSLTGQLLSQALQAGASNAADVEAMLVESGVAPDEAARAADLAFGVSAAMNYAVPRYTPGATAVESMTLRALSGKPLASAMARSPLVSSATKFATPLLGEAVGEGLPEGLDQIILNASTGRPIMEGVGKSFATGLALGAPGGAVAGGVDVLSQPTYGNVTPEIAPRMQANLEGIGRLMEGIQTEQQAAEALRAQNEATATNQPDVLADVQRGIADQVAADFESAAVAAQQEQQSVQAESQEGPGQETVQGGQEGGQGYRGLPGEAQADQQKVVAGQSHQMALESPIGQKIVETVSRMDDPTQVSIVSTPDQIPDELLARAGITADDTQTEAFYDQKTDTSWFITQNIDTAERAGHSAHHEVAHAMLRGALERQGSDLRTEMDRTTANPTVKAVMAAMGEGRPETGWQLAEEAIVELAVAARTGNWDKIEDDWGVEVPESARAGAKGAVQKIIEAIKKWLTKVAGGKRFSDDEVFKILKAANAETKGTRVNSTKGRAAKAAAAEEAVPASKKAPKPSPNERARAVIKKQAKDLTETELAELTPKTADELLADLKRLPNEKDFAAIGWAGRAKRGWYARSVNAISDIFGPDAPRFAALLAATSPQISVEGNLENALSIWKAWIAAGRPTDDVTIKKIMERNVRQGASAGGSSVLGAWINNSVEALSIADPSKIILSGPKVDSFMRNLLGDVNEVTNDAWMARFADVDAALFAGAGRKIDGVKKGRKGSGYLAMNVLVRKAARILTEFTGDTWTPAEVQETIWSWAKTLQDMATGNNKTFGRSDGRNETELLLDKELTDALIASTPDFGTLFSEGKYADILSGAGYAQQVEGLRAARQRDEGQAGEEPAAGRQAGPLAEDAQRTAEIRASERLRKSRGQVTERGLRTERAERARLDNERDTAPGEYDDEVPFSKRPGKNVYGDKQGRDLDGLPKTVTIEGLGKVEFHGFLPAQEIASRFAAKWGSSLPTSYARVDEARAERIAAAYDAMPHSPTSQATSMAYKAMIDETLEQYEAMLEAGVEIHFISDDAHHHGPEGGKGDPYLASPRLAILDVVENNRLYVFPTTSGFGDNNGADAFPGNPLLAPTKHLIDGKPTVANDIFRAVHDYFGHVANGVGFRADGEENAWREHAAMYSPLARRAMTTETRGQNSWVNYGPHGATNRVATSAETVFADQKAGLLPRWVSEDGSTENAIAIEQPMPDVVFKKGDTAIYNSQTPKTQTRGRFGGIMVDDRPDNGEKITIRAYDSLEGLTNVGVPHVYHVTKADGSPVSVWASDVHSEEGGYEANKDKPAIINVGLDIPGGTEKLEQERVLTELANAGADVTSHSTHQSATELTLVAKVAKPITPAALHALSVALEQEAIPQRYADGTGELGGPSAAKWGAFNPDAFTMEDGRSASGGVPKSVKPTGSKNAVTEAEREARGAAPIARPDIQTNEETLEKAKNILRGDPLAGQAALERLTMAGADGITLMDEAVLVIEKQAVMNGRDRAAAILSDPQASAAEKAVAQREYDRSEDRLNAIDQGFVAAGTEWGRFGQLRSQLLKKDFTRAGLERQERAVKKRPLTPSEVEAIKVEAEKIERQQKRTDRAKEALDTAVTNNNVETTHKNLVEEVAKALGAPAKQANPTLERMRLRADESRAALRKMLGRTNAGLDPTALVHLANIGAYHIANGAVKMKAWLAAMRGDLGDDLFTEVEASLPELHKTASAQAKAELKQAKIDRTPAEVLTSVDPELITSTDIYNIARAHVLAGVKGENAVMKATTATVQEIAPSLTERDVRRLFSDYGKATFPSQEADRKELREIRALVQMQESIDRLLEGKAPLKTGQQRDDPTQLVREKRAQLNQMLKLQEERYGASPEKLATYMQTRARNLQHQIEDLEKQIATGERPQKKESPEPSAEVIRLTAIRDALRDQKKAIDEAMKVVPTPEERYQATRARALERQIVEIQARLDAGNYANKTKPVPKELDAANTAQAHRLYLLKQEFHRRQFEWQLSQRGPLGKVGGYLFDALNLSRAVMTSIDLSAVLRQGGFIAFGHPVRAAKAFGPMLKAMMSEAQQLKFDDAMRARPNARHYQSSGLYLTDMDTRTGIAKAEEQYMSRWVGKLPWWVGGGALRGSQRAFTTFLNKLRADSFDTMLETLKKGRDATPEEMKAIASYINVATGRGTAGAKMDQALTGLTTVFFAPRLVASRFNLLLGQPLYAGSAKTRSMIAAEYARFMTGIAMVFALGAMAHGDDEDKLIETDPRSSNFLKMRFGNTFIDPMAGISQVTTFLARELSGETMNTAGRVSALRPSGRWSDLTQMTTGVAPAYDKPGFGQADAADIIGRFARTKLAPVPGALVSMLAGKNVIGDPAAPTDVAVELVTPMSMNNILSIMTEHGMVQGTAIEMLNILGMGVQYRGPDSLIDDKYNAAINDVERAQDAIKTQLAGVPQEDWEAELEKIKAKNPAILSGVTLDTYAENTQNENLGRAGDPKVNKDGSPKLKLETDNEGSVLGELEGYPRYITVDGKPKLIKGKGLNDSIRAIESAAKEIRETENLTAGKLRELAGAVDGEFPALGAINGVDRVTVTKAQREAVVEEMFALRRKLAKQATDVVERAKKGLPVDK